jgi:hypothetical protein
MMGFDFADPESGLSGTVRPSGAAVLFDHAEVLAAGSAEATHLDDAGGGATAGVEIDGVSVQLELSRLGGPVSLRGERAGSEELAACRMLGELRRDGEAQKIACIGIRSDASTDADPQEAGLARSIAVAFADGGLLAARAARPRDATDHGSDEVVAAIADPDGAVTQIREALLSTQYDDAGRHVRATLELWPEQDDAPRPPLRAAGTIVCGTSLAAGERRLDIAFFRWSMSGTPGLGRYEVLHPAGGE